MATIVTRSGKGSPLTNTEVDTNFTNLNAGLTTAAAITGGTISGVTINNSGIGATTPSTGAFTTLSTTGAVTLGDASDDTVRINGSLGIGGAASSVVSSYVLGTHPGTVADIYANRVTQTIPSTASSTWAAYTNISSTTAAASFSVSNVYGFRAENVAAGVGSAITTQQGLYVGDLSSGSFNYGVRSEVIFGTNKWNVYSSGTANNYFGGNVRIGGSPGAVPTTTLDVQGPSGVTSFTGTTWQGLRVRGANSSNDYSGVDFSTQGQSAPTARIGAVFGGSGSSLQFGTSSNYATGVTNTALTIDPSGNVGIGTSSPVSGVRFASIGGSVQLSGGTTSGAGIRIQAATGVASVTGINNDNNAFNAISFATGASEAVRIDTSGNVGIGTASPATFGKFAVQTGATNTPTLAVVSNVASPELTHYITDSGSTVRTLTRIGFNTGSTGSANYQGFLSFSTTPSAGGITERMRIDASGDVQIGRTSALSGAKFSVDASVAQPALAAFVTAANLGAAGIFSKFDNDSTTSNILLQFLINNGAVGSGQINANGASQAAFGSYSDIRLKENVENLPSQLGNVCTLRPVEFDYIDGSGHQVGFIAQEMQQVFPDAIGTSAEGMLTVTGWGKTEARLVKAIQEQQVIIESLRARIEALEAK